MVRDPILTAIARHRAAWDAFQVAPEGDLSLVADAAMSDALDALLATACATRWGALELLGHLSWWLAEEAEFSESYEPTYSVARARAADLTLFLGANRPPLPAALPSDRFAAAQP